MDSSKTIPAQKSAFLRSQIRLLSSVLQPSSTWRSTDEEGGPFSAASASSSPTSSSHDDHDDDDHDKKNKNKNKNGDEDKETTDIPPRTISTVLSKLNHHLAEHNRAVYPPQTQRHIVEQIDALYWRHVTSGGTNKNNNRHDVTGPPGAGSLSPDETLISKDLDLATTEGLDALPDNFADLFLTAVDPHRNSNSNNNTRKEGNAQRYAAARSRLVFLIAEQRRQRGRLEGYRRLDAMLKPFKSLNGDEDDDDEVDEDGDEHPEVLSTELDRMRGLIGRFVETVGRASHETGQGEGGGGGEGGDGGNDPPLTTHHRPDDHPNHKRKRQSGPDNLQTVMNLLAAAE